MSALLIQVDRAFRAVGDGKTRFALQARRHYTVTEHLPESLVVVAEQIGGKVIAPAMALAALGVDMELH
jgi:hypothetical protein